MRPIRARRPTIAEMIERNKPPRARLPSLAEQQGETLAGLSRLIGRPDGYLQRFVAHAVPSKLRREEIDLLARYLGVTPAELGG